MAKTLLFVTVSLLVAASAPACSTVRTQPVALPEQSATSAIAVTVSAQQLDDDTFCQAARQAGITNTAVTDQQADPATLLPVLDQLVPQAPPSIRDDFTTFDTLEHTILDPAHADTAAMQRLNQPATRAALTHVSGYLRNTCHIA